jgi:HPt (histidine-containing phosphotransfer) domain-containing protein
MTGIGGGDNPSDHNHNPSDHNRVHRYKDVERETNLDPGHGAGLDRASTVTTLESDVGPEVYRELLGSFLAQLSVQKVELGTAAAEQDVVAAQFVAHQIAGTASSFGALRLDELATRLMQIDDAEVELLRSLVRDIDAEVASFRGALGA